MSQLFRSLGVTQATFLFLSASRRHFIFLIYPCLLKHGAVLPFHLSKEDIKQMKCTKYGVVKEIQAIVQG